MGIQKALIMRRMNILGRVGIAMVTAMSCGPPERAAFEAECAEHAQDELHGSGRLERAVGEITVIARSETEGADNKSDQADPHTLPSDASGQDGQTCKMRTHVEGQDGEIEISSVGWVKSDYQAINERFAERGKVPAASLIKPGEQVRDYKAG